MMSLNSDTCSAHPPRPSFPHRNSYIYPEGTPFFAVAVSLSGYFRIEDIPEGYYTVRLYDEIAIDQKISPIMNDTLSTEKTRIITVKSDSVMTLEWKM